MTAMLISDLQRTIAQMEGLLPPEHLIRVTFGADRAVAAIMSTEGGGILVKMVVTVKPGESWPAFLDRVWLRVKEEAIECLSNMKD